MMDCNFFPDAVSNLAASGNGGIEDDDFAALYATLNDVAIPVRTTGKLMGATSGNEACLFRKFATDDIRAIGTSFLSELDGTELIAGTDFIVLGAGIVIGDITWVGGARIATDVTGSLLFPFLGTFPGQMLSSLAGIDVSLTTDDPNLAFGAGLAWNSNAGQLLAGGRNAAGTWYRAYALGTPAIPAWGGAAGAATAMPVTDGQDYLAMRSSSIGNPAVGDGTSSYAVGTYGGEAGSNTQLGASNSTRPGGKYSDQLVCLSQNNTAVGEMSARLLTINIQAEDL